MPCNQSMTLLMTIAFGFNLSKGKTMKYLAYFMNLTMFGFFLFSITVVSENPAPLYIGTLVLSTVGLCVMFALHCELQKD